MSVKKYAAPIEHQFEYEHGQFVLHSDYAALLDRHNALRGAVQTLRNLEGGIPEMEMYEAHKLITSIARAEVDRLIASEQPSNSQEAE